MRRLVIDTNLLLLYFVGNHNRLQISSFKRTSKYDSFDYDFIKKFIESYTQVYVTPHILAEIGNLSDHIDGKALEEYFKLLIHDLHNLHEVYLTKSSLTANLKLLVGFGFTDVSILKLAKNKKLDLLTDDKDLYLRALSEGVECSYYTYIKSSVVI